MVDNIKALEKYHEIVPQTNQKMDSLQIKVEELDKWRNMEKCFPSDLPGIKAYDIRLHIVATNECQEMASKFDQMLRKVLWG